MCLKFSPECLDLLLNVCDDVFRYGVRGLVIDPYNELDHSREFESETEYVSQMLSKVKRFAQVRLEGILRGMS
jgi:hypothetical protein